MLSNLLFAVSLLGVTTFVLVSACLASVSLLACYN